MVYPENDDPIDTKHFPQNVRPPSSKLSPTLETAIEKASMLFPILISHDPALSLSSE
jgi:hypothetical protein